MSGMIDLNSKQICFTVTLDIAARIRRFGIEHKLSTNDSLRFLLVKVLSEVNLTKDDLDWIADQLEKNKEKRSEKKSKSDKA